MGRILVGTCSWTDPTLIECGKFYPEFAKSAQARLQYYASQFSIVEVDSSYYALPQERTSALWVERTGDGFLFDVKSFRLFTQHPTPVMALPRDIRETIPPQPKEKANIYLRDMPEELLEELWRRFERALLPLDSAGKLGVVLFQFPQWFFPSLASKDYIVGLRGRLPQYRIAVEFRAASWLDERRQEGTFKLLRENDFSFVCVDEPQGFKSSVPPLYEVTSSIALVRFHGRNSLNWERKGITAAERFRYLYNEAELREWVPRIREMSALSQETHVLMNNCYQNFAAANGQQMALMLQPEAS